MASTSHLPTIHPIVAAMAGITIDRISGTPLVGQFAAKSTDKFSGVSVHTGATGNPLLDGNLATIECPTVETVTGGTHTLFLAEVLTAEARELAPLTYFRGRFGQLRDWVLTPQTPAGQPLDLALLVATLRIDPENLSRALVRLSLEVLVTRRDDGSVVETPINVDVTNRLFGTRCVIQVSTCGSARNRSCRGGSSVLRGPEPRRKPRRSSGARLWPSR